MNLSRPFIIRPVATSLLAIALLLVGLFSYRLLPLSALPEIDSPTIQVVTIYPGAGSQVVASAVSAVLERQLGHMSGLSQMVSTSSTGTSTITLRFNLQLPLDVAEQEVQAAINAAMPEMPDGLAQPPIYHKVNPADTPITTLAITSSTLSLQTLRGLVDTHLVSKLSQVGGVGRVNVDGGQRPAIVVHAKPAALTAAGLTLDDLRNAIDAANSSRAKGSIESATQSSLIAISDPIDSTDAFKRLIVAQRDGGVVRLGDVAAVADGSEDVRQAAWFNEKPAIILRIRRQPGANVVEVADRIQQLLPDLKSTLPAALDITTVSDRTDTVRAAVRDVQLELVFAVLLVVLVIFLFLGSGTATVIPGVVVPLSLIGTFAVMHLTGASINNLTLMALIVATGFMVDDTIVMIENIARHLEAGKPPLKAALAGSRQIAFTVVSLTLSLLAVLIPLLFMSGLVGRLFREFAITLAAAITISGIVSLTLTPMLCARLLRPAARSSPGHMARAVKRGTDRVLAMYARLLDCVLAHQRLAMASVVAMMALAIALYVAIPRGLFPIQDTGEIQATTEASPSVSFTAMAQRQQTLIDAILRDPAVDTVASYIGVGDGTPSLNQGRLLIHLKPLSNRVGSDAVMARLTDTARRINGITLTMQPVPDLTIEDQINPGQYQVSLQGASAKQVATATSQLIERLKDNPHFADVASDQQNLGLEAAITVDRNLASHYGITTAAVSEALYNAFGQRQITTLLTSANPRHVIIGVQPGGSTVAEALGDIYIAAPDGATDRQGPPSGASGTLVPLSSIARVSQRITPLVTTRIDQQPAATVSFNLAPGSALGDTVDAVDVALKNLDKPVGLTVRWQGAAQAFIESRGGQAWLILATIITVYIMLGVLYESYIHPLTILSTLPSAGGGALLALVLGGFELDVISIIGLILLIGIVQKNAIMMIDFALDLQRRGGLAPREAIVQASLLRFRPIIMTTMAAMLGALPLMLGGGVGAELRHPLGVGIFWGLLVSQLLTLFTTPVIYLAFERHAVLRRRSPHDWTANARQ